ncbi:pyridoxal phosphate-dependent transferase [Xylariaceae sp. FL0804]|nr:pyridoxal phosphate-dependent transferase [Xylariaceae sp. FL0804]
MDANGVSEAPLNRADEVNDLIDAVKSLIIPYIRDADNAATSRAEGRIVADAEGSARNVLVDAHEPEDLVKRLGLAMPEDGTGKDGLLAVIRDVLRYSVNTWDQGFLDKLYSSTNAVGVASELLLSVLNTNGAQQVHVYHAAPALTVVEKTTARALARLVGFAGPHAGGVTCQGGSASNLTSIVVARAALYPETKTEGLGGTRRFALFTSAHGHYSVEKAAVTCGMGSGSVRKVAVDARTGRMRPDALRAAIREARDGPDGGLTPLYVNATAGTTVLGSFDDLDALADVCEEEGGVGGKDGKGPGIWLHVDGSWGGSVAFSRAQRHKLRGAARARSLTVNPHKMLGVPVTCSFLLTPDLRVFHAANTLPAGYLFHQPSEASSDEEGGREFWDLADLTLQCGRRADALKLALAWTYHGTAGLGALVDAGFEAAARLHGRIAARPDLFCLVPLLPHDHDHDHDSAEKKQGGQQQPPPPPPCLQVCFYAAPLAARKEANTARTRAMADRLVRRGFMVDYAPGERGSFFRVVVNAQTRAATVDGLVRALEDVAREVPPVAAADADANADVEGC